jgi:Sulfotransferase family
MVRLRLDQDKDIVIHHPHIPVLPRKRRSRITTTKSRKIIPSSVTFLSVFVSSLFITQFVVFLQVWNHHVELHKVVVSILHQQNKTEIADVDSRHVLQKKKMDPETITHETANAANLLMSHTDVWSNLIPKEENLVVNYGDKIYVNNDWNGSPVVIEEYKLIFFTTAKNACTMWFLLLRRMMHIKNWNEVDINVERLLPWNPEYNGLKYLYDFNISYANEIITDPQWTRAIFVRDPKERFLSAYIDKVIRSKNYLLNKCCPTTGDCVEPSQSNITTFLHEVAYFCHNQHWRPQNLQMTSQQWSYVNFVGYMDTIQEDAERLLKRLGVWEKYGRSGWGSNGKEHIFQTEIGDNTGRMHATNAKRYLRSYITPALEIELNEYYANDYNHPIMKLAKLKLF